MDCQLSTTITIDTAASKSIQIDCENLAYYTPLATRQARDKFVNKKFSDVEVN
jgi:hypothetical protein